MMNSRRPGWVEEWMEERKVPDGTWQSLATPVQPLPCCMLHEHTAR